jgi:hypothetical protein
LYSIPESDIITDESTSERSEEVLEEVIINNININSNRARPYFLEGQVKDAYQYWVERGSRKHRAGTEILKKSLEQVFKLFSGTAFKHVDNLLIPQPLLNKSRKFTIEDFKTSLDNYIMALESPTHYPINKDGAIKQRKKLPLSEFIYNPWVKEGSTRSLFLKYLEPPKLISNIVTAYPKLTKQLAIKINAMNLRSSPLPNTIIAAANIFGDLLKKYEYRSDSPASTAELLPEFIEKEIGKSRFERHYLISDWFMFKFEKWLGRKGIINLEEN